MATFPLFPTEKEGEEEWERPVTRVGRGRVRTSLPPPKVFERRVVLVLVVRSSPGGIENFHSKNYVRSLPCNSMTISSFLSL